MANQRPPIRPRPTGQKLPPAPVFDETDVGLPQTVGVRAGGALERVGDHMDDAATAHAADELEAITVDQPAPSRAPVTRVVFPGDDVVRPAAPAAGESPFPMVDPNDESSLLPGDTPADRPVDETAQTRSETAVSSRRMSSRSGRSSRRMSAASSVRKIIQDPAANQRTLLYIAGGVLSVAVVVIVIILLATRHSEGRQHGSDALAEAQRQLDAARNALADRRPSEARKAYLASLAALTKEPALGGAVANPPLNDKQVILDLAQRAAAMRSEVEALKTPLADAEAEQAAEANLGALRARLAKLGDPATDLDALERDLLAYCDNPVDPRSPDAAMAAAYSRLVGEAKLRKAEIVTERARRKAERATVPVAKVRPVVLDLVAQEHFGEALDKLKAAKAEAPDADFAPLIDQANDAAARAWRSAKAYADTRIADWKSPGATAEQRAQAVVAARKRLEAVVEHYGMPEYVDQAKATLATLPDK